VNGVAPGIIKTPLWTDHAEKLRFMDESQDVWVEPEEVAEVMEVLKDKSRHVEWRMDPGPEGPGATLANREKGDEEALGWLAEEGWGVAE
jgi:hypothetical protein